jgi:DNA helicase II / ATP-dependent DNA helicase PcrA
MNTVASVAPRLVEELGSLNRQQLEAVLHEGNVIVRAGPGSGKTRTLVARAAYVLDAQVSPFRGAACITFTNSAADEVRRRMGTMGVRLGDRFSCTTLHSFCLNEILRANVGMTGEWVPRRGEVLSDTDQVGLLQHCFDEVGIAETAAQWRQPQITKIRRAIACEESLDVFDHREVSAARLYDQKLVERTAIDFEAMTTRALRLVQDNTHVQDLLQARFPHLIVDEYQDLGGVLHGLVIALRDAAEVQIFAVGDPDQTVFGFTGADPRYLDELSRRPDFRVVELEMNYRSGQEIIRVSEAALGHMRGRRALDGVAPGEVEIVAVEGALVDHAVEVVRLVQGVLSSGVAPERIAVLYPQKGPLLNELLSALQRAGLPFLFERDEQLPRGSLSRFVQSCASRAVFLSEARRATTSNVEDLLRRSNAPSLLALRDTLLRLRREASLAAPATRLSLLREVQAAIDTAEPSAPDTPAEPWLAHLTRALDLAAVAAGHPDRDNAHALDVLLRRCAAQSLVLQDLAAAVEVIGKVVLTTYHSAKGREFDTVVLPGLVNGLVPRDISEHGNWRAPNAAELAEQRRQFYVALSRAESRAYLITGPGYHTQSGYWWNKGPSVFLEDVATVLGLEPHQLG